MKGNNRRRRGEADRAPVVDLWRAIIEDGRASLVCDQIVRTRPPPARLLARIYGPLPQSRTFGLSLMQREVLELAGEGLTIAASAKVLGLSYVTVLTHRRKAIERMGARTTTQAYAIAFRAHLVKGSSEWRASLTGLT